MVLHSFTCISVLCLFTKRSISTLAVVYVVIFSSLFFTLVMKDMPAFVREDFTWPAEDAKVLTRVGPRLTGVQPMSVPDDADKVSDDVNKRFSWNLTYLEEYFRLALTLLYA